DPDRDEAAAKASGDHRGPGDPRSDRGAQSVQPHRRDARRARRAGRAAPHALRQAAHALRARLPRQGGRARRGSSGGPWTARVRAGAREAMGTVSLDARALKATRRRWQLGTVLCTLFLGVLAVIVLYPLLLVVVDSFEVATPGQPVTYGIVNWVAALTEPGLS